MVGGENQVTQLTPIHGHCTHTLQLTITNKYVDILIPSSPERDLTWEQSHYKCN